MNRPGFSFLVCPDSAILKEELERQAKEYANGWKRHVFWGDEEPGNQFWESLQQVGLFAENRILIIRQAESWPAPVWKAVSQALGQQLDHVWPFFCLEVAFEKGKAKIPAHIQKTRCFMLAEKKNWIWHSEGLGSSLASFVKKYSRQYGLNMGNEELNRFCTCIQPDASAILNELQKLALVATDGKVTADILPQGAASLESDAFGLIRKLAANDLPGVWMEISRDTDGSLLFFLIALLARDFRLLWQINAGENPRMYPGDAQRKRSQAKSLGASGIAKGLAALADAEWQVKSGRQSPSQTLEKLCVDMAALLRPAAS